MARIKKIGSDFKYKFKTAMDSDTKTFLIDDIVGDNSKKATKSTEMHLAQFLEAFKLVSYRVVSGERPEYFVRINSITQIERLLNNSNYRSNMVSMVRERHENSIARMTEFFTELTSDADRWDYVERYFVGMPFQRNDTGNDPQNKQLVKHQKYGTGYIVEIKENKVHVQFDSEPEPKKFAYPGAFDSRVIQKLN